MNARSSSGDVVIHPGGDLVAVPGEESVGIAGGPVLTEARQGSAGCLPSGVGAHNHHRVVGSGIRTLDDDVPRLGGAASTREVLRSFLSAEFSGGRVNFIDAAFSSGTVSFGGAKFSSNVPVLGPWPGIHPPIQRPTDPLSGS